MRVVVANDHAGVRIKADVIAALEEAGCDCVDLGVNEATSVDYPALAAEASRRVLAGDAERAVLICNSGAGMAITANRFPGIRAAVCSGYEEAKRGRRHGDLNVLCLAASPGFPFVVRGAVTAFISTPFDGGRHGRRIQQIDEINDSR